jgi:hypothetical protein
MGVTLHGTYFRQVYRDNAWGDPESISGPGSGLIRTEAFRDQISQLLSELVARSLLEAGCGDFNWMKELELPVERYFGIDFVPESIVRNRQEYSDGKKVSDLGTSLAMSSRARTSFCVGIAWSTFLLRTCGLPRAT